MVVGPEVTTEASAAGGTSDITPYTTLQASLIGVASGLLSLVTITGNFMVMISFKMDKQLQTISNYFLFSLAVADLIIGLISMPLQTVFIIHKVRTLRICYWETFKESWKKNTRETLPNSGKNLVALNVYEITHSCFYSKYHQKNDLNAANPDMYVWFEWIGITYT